MVSQQTVIRNQRGIHLRPSGIIAAALKEFPGTVSLERDGCDVVQLKPSPLSILSLGLTADTTIILHISGPGEEEFSSRLAQLFSQQYDFE